MLLKFYMCRNRPGIVPMLATSFQLPDHNPIVSHFARHTMWFICIDIFKIVNWNEPWVLKYTIIHHFLESGTPASRDMLDRRWANVVTYVGATSVNDVGPTWICPSVQRWHNVVTPPTMTLYQRFANVITYCILLYLMVGTTFAHCLSL